MWKPVLNALNVSSPSLLFYHFFFNLLLEFSVAKIGVFRTIERLVKSSMEESNVSKNNRILGKNALLCRRLTYAQILKSLAKAHRNPSLLFFFIIDRNSISMSVIGRYWLTHLSARKTTRKIIKEWLVSNDDSTFNNQQNSTKTHSSSVTF